jgi:hypothetical protein
MKANKSTAPKVFKLKAFDLAKNAKLQIKKQHHLKKVTTRRFYPGIHRLEIQVNGIVHASADWHFKF